jgi:hypothetical protein
MSVDSTLPRLIYIGDVPVESSYHGSALLYRLLESYPPNQLRIFETNLMRSLQSRRLSGVSYDEIRVGYHRPLYSRFARHYRAWLTCRAPSFVSRLSSDLAAFRPEAVLSVAHGLSWMTAAKFARRFNLPLHLICHDDLPKLDDLPRWALPWREAQFARAYWMAASRFCVSPFMEEAYRTRYGVAGDVLFPSRSNDCPEHNSPPLRLLGKRTGLTGVYAGSINSPGYANSIRLLAECLAVSGGQVLVFSPLDSNDLKRAGLDLPNIRNGGLIPFNELINRCREEADFLYVPMSFEPHDRPNMELSFPSKLTDYTATGVPLLIRGPAYCSAVRWVSEHPGIAECVRTEERSDLRAAIGRLTESGARRFEMAEKALKVGREAFSFSTVHETFLKALRKGGNAGCA